MTMIATGNKVTLDTIDAIDLTIVKLRLYNCSASAGSQGLRLVSSQPGLSGLQLRHWSSVSRSLPYMPWAEAEGNGRKGAMKGKRDKETDAKQVRKGWRGSDADDGDRRMGRQQNDQQTCISACSTSVRRIIKTC